MAASLSAPSLVDAAQASSSSSEAAPLSGVSPAATRRDLDVALLSFAVVFIGVSVLLPMLPLLLLWNAYLYSSRVAALLLCVWVSEVAQPIRDAPWPAAIRRLRYFFFERRESDALAPPFASLVP